MKISLPHCPTLSYYIELCHILNLLSQPGMQSIIALFAKPLVVLVSGSAWYITIDLNAL
ncbi:hypothetical protein M441DRAFT_333535 [Trichoderma asperellum CBS 433.97]|uniref:Uncharacterized protein n=1 Tax=Trichoderma asperellum (strain ATCC 204424 / CBS 433.97 / NBRC 101777) TaxID=1042311 RepID=A0A2T3YRI3_TRIA4|nr:hypothetical protein M441DRAFT_333535 [Trichoderma asperellum CBS 433.97]PTB35191.1 hypothetical protein M441DRAFT_333535 [Trichoderma asperellum CBS 433.97]